MIQCKTEKQKETSQYILYTVYSVQLRTKIYISIREDYKMNCFGSFLKGKTSMLFDSSFLDVVNWISSGCVQSQSFEMVAVQHFLIFYRPNN